MSAPATRPRIAAVAALAALPLAACNASPGAAPA
jgi:predicted small secreted protein